MTEVRYGPYELVERLGQGGMGEVWRARAQSGPLAGRALVVKRMLTHLSSDPILVRAFQREARLCAKLDHPNIVRTYELGSVDGESYLAMEYVAGLNLTQLMVARRGVGLPPGAAATIVASVARALAHAHDTLDEEGRPLRLIHRDVTPSNIMIGLDGVVRLLDFGIAKALSDRTDGDTRTGTLKGKFGYLAPEVADGITAEHSADQFSLGVVLHELLTGRRLFRGESDVQTLALVRKAQVSAPSIESPGLPSQLDTIALTALARDPNERFSSCAALADALSPVAAAEGWNATRLAALVQEAAHASAGLVSSLRLEVEEAATRTQRPAAARPRPRRTLAFVGLGAGVALAALVAVRMSRPQATPTPAAPPTVAPAEAPITTAPALPSAPATPQPRAHEVAAEAPRGPERAVAAAPHRGKRPRGTSRPPTTPAGVGQVRAGKVVDPFAR